jgi:hypothetical protein
MADFDIRGGKPKTGRNTKAGRNTSQRGNTSSGGSGANVTRQNPQIVRASP